MSHVIEEKKEDESISWIGIKYTVTATAYWLILEDKSIYLGMKASLINYPLIQTPLDPA